MNDRSETPGKAAFTALVCNDALPPFGAAHGLALLVKPVSGEPLLFDTGPDAALLASNLALAGLPACPASGVVLSHGHYDHAGGLPALAGCSPALTLYAGEGFEVARYHVSGHGSRSIGLPPCVDTSFFRLVLVRGTLDLPGGVKLVSPVPLRTSFERGGRGLAYDVAGRKPDRFEDETVLALEVEGGVAVFSGCSHRGVVNAALAASKAFDGARVKAVIGGFHLGDEGRERFAAVADAFEEMEVERVIAGHCTGRAAMDYFARRLGSRFEPLEAGRTYAL